jgi:hypothetical protein
MLDLPSNEVKGAILPELQSNLLFSISSQSPATPLLNNEIKNGNLDSRRRIELLIADMQTSLSQTTKSRLLDDN